MEPNVAAGQIRLVACPHLLSIEKDRLDLERPVGGTVADHMQSIAWHPTGMCARVFLDGKLVKDAEWEYTVPSAGQSLVMRAIPMDSGSGQGKDAMRIGLMVGVVAASIFTAGAAAGAVGVGGSFLGIGAAGWGGIAGAATSMLGSLAVTGRIPPPLPRLCDRRREVDHG